MALITPKASLGVLDVLPVVKWLLFILHSLLSVNDACLQLFEVVWVLVVSQMLRGVDCCRQVMGRRGLPTDGGVTFLTIFIISHCSLFRKSDAHRHRFQLAMLRFL